MTLKVVQAKNRGAGYATNAGIMTGWHGTYEQEHITETTCSTRPWQWCNCGSFFLSFDTVPRVARGAVSRGHLLQCRLWSH